MKKQPSYLFRSPRRRIIAEAVAAAGLTGLILFMVFSDSQKPDDDLKAGLSYIKSLEKASTAPIEKEIKEIKKAERKASLENGELDVWQQFNDAAILGDSRAVGFSFYDFVEDNRVFAENGATIRNIPDYIESLKALNPSNVFLCFGLNDIVMGFWETTEDYTAELDKTLEELHKGLPDAAIYVNSILPAIDPAFERSSKWREIPDWNKKIKQHCLDKEIPYIDITETAEEHKNLYEIDGIHMQKDFYPCWAVDMMTEVYDNE